MRSTRVSTGLIVVLAIFTVTLLATSTRAAAQEVVLYSFDPSTGDGKEPSGGVVFHGNGLYGTTVQGGTNGLGTVFEIAEKNGIRNETVPHPLDFDNTNGSGPTQGLLPHAGKLYGTTQYGGLGYGTVFELTYTPGTGPGTGWNQTFTYNFTASSPTDGQNPSSPLIFANGNIYGTTSYGGNSFYCGTPDNPIGCGTVFQLAPVAGGGWTESVVYNFAGVYTSSGVTYYDGAVPVGILFSDNAIYGVTEDGGEYGEGRVFELNPSTWVETVLYDFPVNQGLNTTGAVPLVGLAVDSSHNLYGTTSQGGGHNAGVVFELSPLLIKVGRTFEKVWIQTTLHDFDSTVDGQQPSALTVDSSNNLYGTTGEGGPNYGGTVFELPAGSTVSTPPTILHSFCDAFVETCTGMDGQFPSSGLTFDKAGNLYGTTLEGGTYGWGTVFGIFLNSFTLTATPGALSVARGGEASTTISMADIGNFAGTVKLTASGLPRGVAASFNPTSISAGITSTLTLTASSKAPLENGTPVTVTGTVGSLEQNAAPISVSVAP